MALTIADDGSGFDTQGTTSGIGIASMHERTVALDGDLRITSGSRGTEVRARIPVAG